jgi:hypothetical protein
MQQTPAADHMRVSLTLCVCCVTWPSFVNSQSAFNPVSYEYDSIAICHLRSQHYRVSQLVHHNALKPDAFDNRTSLSVKKQMLGTLCHVFAMCR